MHVYSSSKVNLSDFPNLSDLRLRRSIDLSGDSSSVTDGVSNVASSVAEGMDSAASEASTAVEGIATKASTAAGTVSSSQGSQHITPSACGAIEATVIAFHVGNIEVPF
ncbi:hypothetical protein AbraIFM66951_005101 [Aspergillus brasiliensis]|nr:hypothetical protein AbraIFM66951_005101 [Aspergillus brasiliensis]